MEPEMKAPLLSKSSSVLAVIPFYRCEEWLEESLWSLTGQSRPPQGIVVVDDGSAKAPLEMVQKFKSVTLWRSPENVGPYRLIQSVIEKTGYDAYLFQDADDWSSWDRLERLLEEAEKTGAEMVGSQELMYFKDSVLRNNYPLDVNAAVAGHPAYALLHPSSLVSRNLILRAGGYATGLKFSGDMEFLLRAVLVGKAVNLDRYCYFRRIRMNSLITSETTGLASPARQMIDTRVRARAKENAERIAQGLAPLLQPLETARTIALEHLTGPELIPDSSSQTR
jgi:glycosyltransferase involved in cell wall biosynthesis